MEQEKNVIPNDAVEAEEVSFETVETGNVTEEVAPAADGAVAAKPQRNFLQKIKFDKWKGWIYLLPCLILILIFTLWPIVNTLIMAFSNGYTAMGAYNGETYTFGFENFTNVFNDTLVWSDDGQNVGFLTCIKNTVLLCVITVPLSTLLALLIAVCLNSIKPLQKFFQTIFFLPYVTNSIAIGMVFAAMFKIELGIGGQMTDAVGIMNKIIGVFGAEPINWIGDGSSYFTKMCVMVFYIVWNALPFKILILLGGLQSVNKQYYEAAKIDSTPRWRVFTKITVPLLSPMLAYVIITGFIGGFKEYSSVIGVFGNTMGTVNDPYQLVTMVGYIYPYLVGTGDDISMMGKYGLASAAALILFAMIFVVTMINLYVSKKKTHY